MSNVCLILTVLLLFPCAREYLVSLMRVTRTYCLNSAAGVCSAQVLRPVFMCSQNSSTPNKRTLYTSFSSTQQNVDVIYPVGSKNALYVVGNETVLLNSGEQFNLVNTTRTYFYPQFFEQLDVDIGVQVTWYLDGVISNLTLDSTSDCPASKPFTIIIIIRTNRAQTFLSWLV